MLGGFGDHRSIFFTILSRRLAGRHVLNGRKADLAGRGRDGFFKRDIAPFDASLRRVLQVELDGRLRGLRRNLVNSSDERDALGVDRSVDGMLRFGGGAGDGRGHAPAVGVGPDDAHETTVTRILHAGGLARGAELYEVPAHDAELLLVPAVEAVPGVVCDDQGVAFA